MSDKNSSLNDKLRPGERIVSVYKNGSTYRAVALGMGYAAPSVLSLKENHEETARFINHLIAEGQRGFVVRKENNELVKKQERYFGCPIVKDYYDFSSINQISTGVALILASIFDTHLRCGGQMQGAVNIHLWDPTVRATLYGLGFMNMAKVDLDSAEIVGNGDIGILRFKSGSEADGEQVSELLGKLGVAQIMDYPELYDALIEALVNVRQHAYPSTYIYGFPHYKGWWIAGLVRRQTRAIKLVAYDRGVGIPFSINNAKSGDGFEAKWVKAFPSRVYKRELLTDGVAIHAAMQIGRSSTGDKHRGHGLPAMGSLTEYCTEASFTIVSGKGVYAKEKGMDAVVKTLGTSLPGTLVTWDLKF